MATNVCGYCEKNFNQDDYDDDVLCSVCQSLLCEDCRVACANSECSFHHLCPSCGTSCDSKDHEDRSDKFCVHHITSFMDTASNCRSICDDCKGK